MRSIVDSHLRRLDLKRPGLSNHALRHAGARLAYKYTHDLRAVQDMLVAPIRAPPPATLESSKALNTPQRLCQFVCDFLSSAWYEREWARYRGMYPDVDAPVARDAHACVARTPTFRPERGLFTRHITHPLHEHRCRR